VNVALEKCEENGGTQESVYLEFQFENRTHITASPAYTYISGMLTAKLSGAYFSFDFMNFAADTWCVVSSMFAHFI
jgi:hypothetical protein